MRFLPRRFGGTCLSYNATSYLRMLRRLAILRLVSPTLRTVTTGGLEVASLLLARNAAAASACSQASIVVRRSLGSKVQGKPGSPGSPQQPEDGGDGGDGREEERGDIHRDFPFMVR